MYYDCSSNYVVESCIEGHEVVDEVVVGESIGSLEVDVTHISNVSYRLGWEGVSNTVWVEVETRRGGVVGRQISPFVDMESVGSSDSTDVGKNFGQSTGKVLPEVDCSSYGGVANTGSHQVAGGSSDVDLSWNGVVDGIVLSKWEQVWITDSNYAEGESLSRGWNGDTVIGTSMENDGKTDH